MKKMKTGFYLEIETSKKLKLLSQQLGINNSTIVNLLIMAASFNNIIEMLKRNNEKNEK